MLKISVETEVGMCGRGRERVSSQQKAYDKQFIIFDIKIRYETYVIFYLLGVSTVLLVGGILAGQPQHNYVTNQSSDVP